MQHSHSGVGILLNRLVRLIDLLGTVPIAPTFWGMTMDDKKLIGYKDGMAVYVSDELLVQKGEREVREQLGMIRRYPVKTDLSGNIMMVEGDSHEDAVQRYLSRTIKMLCRNGERRRR